MSKSHVSLEQKLCKITGKLYDTDAILFDKRLQNSMERHTTTGWGISPPAQEKLDAGYVALVEIDESKSTVSSNGSIKPEGAYRLRNVVYIKEEAFKTIFNSPLNPISFVSTEVIEYLEKLNENL